MKVKAPDRNFRYFYSALVYIAAAALVTPGIYLFMRSSLPIPWLAPVIALIFIIIGSLLQSLYAVITHHQRADVTYEYETNESSFKSSQAFLPIIAAAVISLVMRAFIDSLLYRAYEAGYIEQYDEYSIIPYAAMMLVFVLMIIGIVMWFFSVERFGSIKVFLPCLAVITIEYILSLYGGGSTGTVCAACLAVFIICALIVMNQTYIIRTFRGSVVSVITPRSRMFNLLIVLLLFSAVLVIMGVMALTLYGLVTLIKMLFFMAMFSADLDAQYAGGERYYDEVELESSFAKVVYGSRSQSQSGQLFFVMFAVLFVAFMLFMIFRRTDFIKNLVERIKQWIEDMIAFFDNAAYFQMASIEKKEDVISYKDEEKKLQNAEIREYNASKTGDAKNYREFQSRLSRLKTTDEKLTYAYVTLIALYRKMNIRIVPSDTPREISKIVNTGTETGHPIEEITSALELVKYAEIEPEPFRIQSVLESMCMIIKKYMY